MYSFNFELFVTFAMSCVVFRSVLNEWRMGGVRKTLA